MNKLTLVLLTIIPIIVIIQTQTGPTYNGEEIITQYNLDVRNDTLYQQAIGYMVGNNSVANVTSIIDLNDETDADNPMRFKPEQHKEFHWTEEKLDKNFQAYRNLTCPNHFTMDNITGYYDCTSGRSSK